MVGALLAVAKVYSDIYSDYVLSLCVLLCNYEAHCGQTFETESVLTSRDLTYFFFILTSFKHISELFIFYKLPHCDHKNTV